MAEENENQETPEVTVSSEETEVPVSSEDPNTSSETATSSAGETVAAEEAPAQAPKRKPRAKKKPVVVKAMTPEERHAARLEVRRKKAVARRAERAQARAKYKAAEHERRPTPPREHVPGAQKTRQGIVVSDKADKTITVRIDVVRRHRRYEKIVRTSNTVHAHDSTNDAHTGDTVVVRECRPLSRTKRWRLVEVVERAK
jgi:small subunit ribosomal protein S17